MISEIIAVYIHHRKDYKEQEIKEQKKIREECLEEWERLKRMS
jgi:predicted transposase YbfD/YdcC